MIHMAQFQIGGSVPKRAETPGTLRYLARGGAAAAGGVFAAAECRRGLQGAPVFFSGRVQEGPAGRPGPAQPPSTPLPASRAAACSQQPLTCGRSAPRAGCTGTPPCARCLGVGGGEGSGQGVRAVAGAPPVRRAPSRPPAAAAAPQSRTAPGPKSTSRRLLIAGSLYACPSRYTVHSSPASRNDVSRIVGPAPPEPAV
jgi:hypothetical protein